MKPEDAACPWCKVVGKLSVTTMFVSAKLGTYSLAGGQPKIDATIRPVLRCAACHRSIVGNWDDDGRHVTFDLGDAR